VSGALLLVAFGVCTVLEMKDRQARFDTTAIRDLSDEFNLVYSILRDMALHPEEGRRRLVVFRHIFPPLGSLHTLIDFAALSTA
jgi:hypothetical protein